MKLLPTSFVPLGPEIWWNQRAAGKDAAMTLQITPSLPETWISDTDPNGGVCLDMGGEARREFLYSGIINVLEELKNSLNTLLVANISLPKHF